ncbi:DUF3823 domain-containing protein [Pontibacter diazotrophicus]|uniref:DUF3823 domain-containing protein n=1 Tax=Pontibacter diazotrophicus TaxID=1400979 RepID=A0A3D8L2B9_9BACT|nr:DUF3823 domain-containing protein [Pontibacter diazotrophicus]RDV11520.1 DUF3823 domain-containing protein [Pontibacter diazotrophicus]
MKFRLITYIMAMVVVLSGCEYDNHEPPKTMLTGKVVYQDQAIGVRSSGVQLELWQPGYPVLQKIPVYVDQEGTFSAMVFDGNYKLTRLRGNGPWVDNTDTIDVQVQGNTVVEVPVQPFFLIRNEQFQNNGNAVTTTLNVEALVPGAKIERVTYYLGSTTIVDANNFAAVTDIWWPNEEAVAAPMSMSLEVPANIANKGYVFARVGVKIADVAEMIYSPVEKVEL